MSFPVGVTQEVIEAAIRLLDPDQNHYPGLVLAGSQESAKLFHDDVMKVTEAFAELIGVKG